MKPRFHLPVSASETQPAEAHIVDAIAEKLARVELEQDVTILYACESGSRAWGFASPDSDYDVRFVYVNRLDWYLRVAPERDVIEETPGPVFDVGGWDLRKALGLLRKGNAVIGEWLDSPLVYAAEAVFTKKLREERRRLHDPVRAHHHYLHMAEGNLREYLRREIVRTKKYFYVLRPILACRWIEAGLGPVPMKFSELLNASCPPGALRAEIDALLVRKTAGDELAEGPRIPLISNFLESELERLAAKHPPGGDDRDYAPLDVLLSGTIRRFDA